MSYDIRYIGTAGRTSTYKVTDPKVEGGEAVVIAVDEGDRQVVNCLTCPGYRCEHARAVARHVGNPVSEHTDGRA